MSDTDESLECATCGGVVAPGDARRTKTMGGLDPTRWQTLCCPNCGARLKTMFVGGE